jgi:hypothetical protein
MPLELQSVEGIEKGSLSVTEEETIWYSITIIDYPMVEKIY